MEPKTTTDHAPYGFDAETAAHFRGDCGVYYRRIAFDNGYAVSIVSHKHSHGGNSGLFEVAVMQASTDQIVYDTPITGDVLGHLDFADVAEVIAKVRDLPTRIYWPKSAFTVRY